jgi:hypothetical protein
MAIFTGTYLTFTAIGQREDLADAIYDISPEDTPLTSMCAKGSADAVLSEWQLDSLGAVDTANAQLEGDDITTIETIVPTVRVGNRQQISRKLLSISGTTEAVKSAGSANSLARQTTRRGVEMKRDIESMLFQAGGSVAGGATTARVTAKLGAWVKTNVDKEAGGSNPDWTSGVPEVANERVDGTPRAFTETILKSVINLAWTSGATIEGKYLFCGPVNKVKVSGFAGIATKTYNIGGGPAGTVSGQATIVAAADVYVSDFGTLQVIPSRFMREQDAYIIDPDFLEIEHLRPFRVVDLATTGDAKKKMLLQEWGLKVKAENALALAADLTTTA